MDVLRTKADLSVMDKVTTFIKALTGDKIKPMVRIIGCLIINDDMFLWDMSTTSTTSYQDALDHIKELHPQPAQYGGPFIVYYIEGLQHAVALVRHGQLKMAASQRLFERMLGVGATVEYTEDPEQAATRAWAHAEALEEMLNPQTVVQQVLPGQSVASQVH